MRTPYRKGSVDVKLVKDVLTQKRCNIRITSQVPVFKQIESRILVSIATCEYANSYRICPQLEIKERVESIFRLARKSMDQILGWVQIYEDRFTSPTIESIRIIKNLVILSDMLHDFGFDIEVDGFIRDAMVLEKIRRIN